MTKTILLKSVAEQEDSDTKDIFHNDYESFVGEQQVLTHPAGSVKIGPSRQLSARTFYCRQESYEGRQSSDSTSLRPIRKSGSTTSLASASTAAGSPNSSPGSAYRGEELSFGQCQSGRSSIETSLSRSTTMFENPQIGLSNGDESCSFAEWALAAQKRCPDARLEPGTPRPVARLWLHKVIEKPSDEREAQVSSQVKAPSPLLPSTSSSRKHKHWMLKA